MNKEVSDWIGYRWLAQRYGVSPVQAFRTDSAIARSRATLREDGYTHQFYPSSARPADTLVAHLGFALKQEGIHLEFLARLFGVGPVAELDLQVGQVTSAVVLFGLLHARGP